MIYLWPSRKREMQAVLDSEPVVNPPRPGKEPWKAREMTASEQEHYLAELEASMRQQTGVGE